MRLDAHLSLIRVGLLMFSISIYYTRGSSPLAAVHCCYFYFFRVVASLLYRKNKRTMVNMDNGWATQKKAIGSDHADELFQLYEH